MTDTQLPPSSAGLQGDDSEVPIAAEFHDLEKQQSGASGSPGQLGKRDAKRLQCLQEVERSGKCAARSAAGTAFLREISDKEREAYDKLADRDKENFRVRWSKTSIGMLQAKRKEKLESWQVLDTTIGRYMSVSKAWQEEGGQACDIEPTRLMAKKLLKMGPPWSRFNGLTERNDIFVTRHEHREQFLQQYSLFKVWEEKPSQSRVATASQIVAGKGVGSKGRGQGAIEDKTEHISLEPKVAATPRKPKPTVSTGDQPGAHDPTPAKRNSASQGIKRSRSSVNLTAPLDMKTWAPRDVEAHVQKMRRLYMEAMVVSGNLASSIDMKDDKKWSRISGMCEDLNEKKQRLADYVNDSPFCAKLINMDFAALKAMYKNDQNFTLHLTNTASGLSPLVQHLNEEIAMLNNMYQLLPDIE